LREAKDLGFSDEQIIRIMKEENAEVIYERRKAMGLTRVFKMVDTCAAEFEAKTPYFYSTFEAKTTGPAPLLSNESKVSDKKKIIVLGSGPNRVLNLIIAVYMVCWPLKKPVLKPSWSTAILKQYLQILTLQTNYILSPCSGNICGRSLNMKNRKALLFS